METILPTLLLLLLSSRKIPQSSNKSRSSLFWLEKPWDCLVSSRLVHPPHTRFLLPFCSKL